MANEQEEYLGDGVYASFDGFQIWLKTGRGHDTHEIALEPTVYARFSHYARRVYRLDQVADNQGQNPEEKTTSDQVEAISGNAEESQAEHHQSDD